MSTTTGESLADLMVGIVRAAAVAANVYGVRAWPTQSDQYPQVQFELPDEDKLSGGPHGAQSFKVTASLPIILKVKAPAEEDEEGAAAARAELGTLARQVEKSIIGHPALYRAGVSHFPFVHSRARISAEGREILGQRVLVVGVEFWQAGDDFYEPDAEAVEEVHVDAELVDGQAATLVVEIPQD